MTHTRTDDSIMTNKTMFQPILHWKLISISILRNRIHDFLLLKALKLLNVTTHKNGYSNSTFMKSSIVPDSFINLQIYQRRKLHEKFRNILMNNYQYLICIYTSTTLKITSLW